MDAEPIQEGPTEDQIGPRLAELSASIRAGQEAMPVRITLMRYAIKNFHWTQERIAEACGTSQAAVSKTLKRSRTPRSPTT